MKHLVLRKTAIITGAGGVLGGSIAKSFLEAGAKVVAIDIHEETWIKEWPNFPPSEVTWLELWAMCLISKVWKTWPKKYWPNGVELTFCWIFAGEISGATLLPDQEFFDNLKISDWDKVTNLNLNGNRISSMALDEQWTKCWKHHQQVLQWRLILRHWRAGYSVAKTGISNFTQWLATEMAMKYGDGIV